MVPKFEDCMLPIMTFLSDGKAHTGKEILNHVVEHFNLSEDDVQELLPSKKGTRLATNFSWAKSFLKVAKLINSPKRNTFIITDEGMKLLAKQPQRIDTKLLSQYPSFKEWQQQGKKETKTTVLSDVEAEYHTTEKTPEETIAYAFQQIKKSLAQELLDEICNQSPAFFETLVVKLLLAMGYGGSFNELSEMVVGKTGDEGIDGIIKEDRLGLDNIYIQAKRWNKDHCIGRPEIQKFVGALTGQGANKGIFITTAYFSEQAKNFKPYNNIKVALIDGEKLCEYMMEHNLGVTTQETYEVKRLDRDFFANEE